MKPSRRLALLAAPALALAVLAWANVLVFGGRPDARPRPPTDPVAAALVSPDPLRAAAVAPDPPIAAQAARVACGSVTGEKRQACYESYLERRLAARGIEDALVTLERLAAADPDADSDSHIYAHGLGIAAYAHHPDLARTFARCSPVFSSGCFHGVMQAYFEDDRRRSSDLNAICAPYKGGGQTAWLLFQCVHGMGHGLEMFRDHDLPRALSDCDRLTEDWDRQSCYGGAFMENIMNVAFPHHPATLLAAQTAHHGQAAAAAPVAAPSEGAASGAASTDAARAEALRDVLRPGVRVPPDPFRAMDRADPYYPCSIVQERFQVSCYLIQTAAILYLNGEDVAAAAWTCERAPRTLRTVCFQSLGRDLTSYAKNDPRETIRLCDLGPPRYRTDCYVGAVKVFVDLKATIEPGFDFCRRLGPASKPRCYEALGEEIAALASRFPQRAALCESSEREQVDACRFGARLSDRRPAGLVTS